MNQVVRDFRTGEVRVEEVPSPHCLPQGVLVQSVASLISSGTERAALRPAGRTVVGKALERPDLLYRAWHHFKTKGLTDVVTAVRARLETPQPLGYSAAGVILQVGPGTEGFAVGDAVACAGAGYASHAEVNWIPKNLCVRMPQGVGFKDAASVALGAIALQGVRVAEVRIGERAAVVGLGLVGLLTAQILKAAGCVVWGFDLDPERVELARELGLDAAFENRQWKQENLDGARESSEGMDVVFLTASTRSAEPVDLAGRLARERGVVVVVGDVRVDVPRELYYRKELQLRYSRSYGPGRYDLAYEERGADYPYGFVRWTENRNMQAYLDLVAAGKVRLEPLITHRFGVEKAKEAYNVLANWRQKKCVGIVLTYPHSVAAPPVVRLQGGAGPLRVAQAHPDIVRIGWIGAGKFSRGKLLPAVRKVRGVELVGLANATGISARRAATEFGFQYCCTDALEVLNDPLIDAVFIGTRHDLHASLTATALDCGKHVFVEKPLCVNEAELELISAAHGKAGRIITVGFNRRFSPFARECRQFFDGRREALSIVYRVNAAGVPRTHWLYDPDQGHGAIIGEVCHFVDAIQYLTASLAVWVEAQTSGSAEAGPEGDLHVRIGLGDGSLAEILYVCSGDLQVPKERMEVFGAGRTAICEDYRTWRFYHRNRCHTHSRFRQDKGHREEMRAFVEAVARGGQAPISLESLRATSLATFGIRRSLSSGLRVPICLSTSASAETSSPASRRAEARVAGALGGIVC